MKSFQRGVFQRKRINEYGEQRGKSKQNDLDLATDLYWFSFTFFLDSGRSHNQNVTLESTLSEISGLIKISVKHKREEKYLGRNATSFIQVPSYPWNPFTILCISPQHSSPLCIYQPVYYLPTSESNSTRACVLLTAISSVPRTMPGTE